MPNKRVATCGDCIHAIVCKQVNGSWFSPNNPAYCQAFKNKEDYVEIVRCRECKHYVDSPYDNEDMMCDNWGEWIFPNDDDFCSCGERKDDVL